jgi:hypothetical protein
MTRNIGTALLVLGACASTVLASAQATSSPTEDSQVRNNPVAFVYVSSVLSNGSLIQAYTAATNGTLVATVGTYFIGQNISYMAVNDQYLFATDGVNIDSFSISPKDGALTEVSSINAQALNQDGCGGPTYLFLDHTGSTLYDLDYLADCANNGYQAFSGTYSNALNYLDTAPASAGNLGPLSFIGNNVYGYNASCYRVSPNFYVYQRASDGTLSPNYSINPALPQAPTGEEFCPGSVAADPYDHLAIAMAPIFDSNGQPAGLTRLAVYTADSTGNITTSSTYSNMPKTAAGTVNDIWMSPSGRLLAVAGSKGLQVFHFNGANPITDYTGLLTTDAITTVFWDKANHLYALSKSAGKLYVFTVTPSSAKEAAGSPYAIANPIYLSVLPRP